MKSFRSWFALCAFFFLTPGVFAQFTYTTNGSTITVTGYQGTIPSALTISNFVTSIEAGAFDNSSTLASVAIGSNVTSIGENPFLACSKLAGITVSAQNTNFSSANGVLFNKSGTTLLVYPAGGGKNYTVSNGVTNITALAFQQCDTVTNVILPASVISIGQNAFFSCSSLSSVTISNGVTSIGASAFEICPFASIAIPDSVTSIGVSAFQDCSSLSSITIGRGVTNIGLSAFTACHSLTAFAVSPENAYYSSVNGVLFDKAQATLVQYPGGASASYTIPNGVTTIADDAFGPNLANIIMPNSVTSIGEGAFDACTSLTNVTFGNGLTNIGEYAFESCWDLETITLPGSVTTIGLQAFANNFLTGVLFEGNAPASTDPTAFSAGTAPTIYDLPGTANWAQFTASTGLTPVLWNPSILINDGNFGVRNNQFGFTITGTADIPIVVQAATSLPGAWTPLQSCTLTNGSIYFSDPAWTNYPGRFYSIAFP